MIKKISRVVSLVAAIAVVASLVTGLPGNRKVSAAQITDRSLTLEAGVTDGGSMPGGNVKHLFIFSVGTTANIGSIQFQYCTLAAGTCTMPTGLVTTAATISNQTGATGFTMVNATNGAPYISRTAASITSGTSLSYELSGIVNPTTTNQTFYVRISTYTSTNATTGLTDSGNVAASTATQIQLSGQMPESLVFCAGGTVSTTGGVPDCTTASSGSVTFNQLFSPTDTATATSQMAASTNAGSGYVITVNGPTLTSGSNTVAALASSQLGVHGLSEFGLNLKANTTVTSTTPVGTEVAPAANGTNYRGEALSGYNTIDNFKFNSTDPVADSKSGGPGGSDAQIYTVSYIVNVPGSQPAGTYTTTLTYICTPTF